MTPLDYIAWNCYVANSSKNVEASLTDWAVRFNPHAFMLTEARTHHPSLVAFADDNGYHLLQETPNPNSGSVVDDTGDSALLIRKDVPIIRTRTAKMRAKWKVARYNRTHTPRKYEVAVIELDGQRWKVRASHFPTNGFKGNNWLAFRESALKAKTWALATRRGVATVDAGDFNDTVSAFRAYLGKRFVVTGKGIDLSFLRNVRHVQHWELGKGGGDHHAQRYQATPGK